MIIIKIIINNNALHKVNKVYSLVHNTGVMVERNKDCLYIAVSLPTVTAEQIFIATVRHMAEIIFSHRLRSLMAGHRAIGKSEVKGGEG